MDQQSEKGSTSQGSNRKLFLLLGLAAIVIGGGVLYAILGNKSGLPKDEVVPPAIEYSAEEVVDSIHLATGLKVAKGFEIVRAQCTPCHSGKLVAQNRATRAGWEEMIRWMQKTQGLWPLGENEPVILDYLATNYGPEETGRRANLEGVEWYILELGD